MAKRLYSNNAASTLDAALTAGSTSLAVVAGTGALFPTLSGGDWFVFTIEDLDTGIYEICKCTARSGDTFTIERAQEGTTALAWAAGVAVELRQTAGQLSETLIHSQVAGGDITPSVGAIDLSGTIPGYALGIRADGSLGVGPLIVVDQTLTEADFTAGASDEYHVTAAMGNRAFTVHGLITKNLKVVFDNTDATEGQTVIVRRGEDNRSNPNTSNFKVDLLGLDASGTNTLALAQPGEWAHLYVTAESPPGLKWSKTYHQRQVDLVNIGRFLGDEDKTIYAKSDGLHFVVNVPLTAARTITISDLLISGGSDKILAGTPFTVSRTALSNDTNTLSVARHDSTVLAQLKTSQGATFVFDGTNLLLVSFIGLPAANQIAVDTYGNHIVSNLRVSLHNLDDAIAAIEGGYSETVEASGAVHVLDEGTFVNLTNASRTLIVLSANKLLTDGDGGMRAIGNGVYTIVPESDAITINGVTALAGEVTVSDFAADSASGAQIKFKSPGGNLPAKVVNDYILVASHPTEPTLEGWFIVDVVTTSTQDYTVTKLVNADASEALTNPQNATTASTNLDSPALDSAGLPLRLKSLASFKRSGSDIIIPMGTSAAKGFDFSDLVNIASILIQPASGAATAAISTADDTQPTLVIKRNNATYEFRLYIDGSGNLIFYDQTNTFELLRIPLAYAGEWTVKQNILCSGKEFRDLTLKDVGESTHNPSSSGGTLALFPNTGGHIYTTLTENVTTVTFGFPQPSGKSHAFILEVTQGAGPYSITWPASVKWPGGTAPTLSAGSGDIDFITFVTRNNGTTWYGFVAGQDMS